MNTNHEEDITTEHNNIETSHPERPIKETAHQNEQAKHEDTKQEEKTHDENKQEETHRSTEDEQGHQQTTRRGLRTRVPRVPLNIGASQEDLEERLGLSLTDFYGYGGTTTTMPMVSQEFIPNSYSKALSCEDSPKWLKSLTKNF